MKSLATKLKHLLKHIFLICFLNLNSNWIAETELITSGVESMDRLGCTVPNSGNTLVVDPIMATAKKQINQ